MLKAAVINYLKYYKELFKMLLIITLSVVLFVVIFDLSIMLPIKNESLNSYTDFFDNTQIYLSSLELNNLFEKGFLTNIFKEIVNIFNTTNSKINFGTILVLISVIIIIGAFFFSQYLCKKEIKNQLSNKDTLGKKTQLAIKIILSVFFWIIIFFVTLHWFWAIFLLPFVISCFNAIKVLLTTWSIYFNKYKLRKFITIKNICKLVITNSILLYLHTLIIVSISAVSNYYVLIILVLTFIAYTSCITEFTATKYFIEKRSSKELSKK